MTRFVIPLGVFVALVAFLGVGLSLNPREIPSPLVGKSAPDFSMPQLRDPQNAFSQRDLAGQVWLLNVWASWCSGCREEHPVLMKLAESDTIPIYGLAYKDRRTDALAWLGRWGDPYQVTGMDESGRVGIEYGVYGVPETFLIDKKGVIRYKQIGPLDDETVHGTLLPLIRELQNQ